MIAIAYGGAMLLNIAWHRACCNPKPKEYGVPPLLNFHVGFLNNIPIFWTVVVGITLVGAIYYFAVQRNKPFTPVVPPDETVPASSTPL